MKDNIGIKITGLIVLFFVIGVSLGAWLAPEVRTVEKVVEVEKIEKIPTPNADIYNHCVMQARRVLYTSMSEAPKAGTTPENTKDFIDNCFEKLSPHYQ